MRCCWWTRPATGRGGLLRSGCNGRTPAGDVAGDRSISASRSGLAASQPRRGEQRMSRILVTGATRGLGRALVKELSRRDHAVVATGRRLEDMADLPAPERLVLDLTNPATIHDAMAAAARLDVVINNAAMTVSGPVEAVPASLVEQVLVTNVLGPLRAMQAALPTMRERSEEHTSELQSRGHLVCRLLIE